MKLKHVNVSKEAILALVGFGLIVGLDLGCAPHDNVDSTALEKETAAARTLLDSVVVARDAAVAARDMYQHKCDSLCPVFGVVEDPAVRAHKNTQWRHYRDSVSKYNDIAVTHEIARELAQLRVDILESRLRGLKSRSR